MQGEGVDVGDRGASLKQVHGALHHAATAEMINMERSVLRGIGGGCQVPFGAHCTLSSDGSYSLDVFCVQSEQPKYATFNSEQQEDLVASSLKYVLNDEGIL